MAEDIPLLENENVESIASKSVHSVSWNLAANLISTLLGLIRIFVVARYVDVAVFGIYGKALSFVMILQPFLNFGFLTARLHREKNLADDKTNNEVFFTLSIIFSVIWSILMVILANLFFDMADYSTRTAFYVLIAAQAVVNLRNPPMAVFERKVSYKTLSIITIVETALGCLAAILLGVLKQGIWALVSVNIAMSLVPFFVLYFRKLSFRPRLNLQRSVVRYFLRFGSKRALESLIYHVQDRIDDLWIATYLGNVPAGLYTQAHFVARYPLKIISLPVITVARGTYSALKEEARAFVQSFETVNQSLMRFTVFVGGAFLLLSHEFIMLYLGEKWLPMENVMRIMVIYMMIEPIKESISYAFSALGFPELGIRARIWQLGSLAAGIALFSLLLPWGIEGVALAVNVSIVVGLIVMIRLMNERLTVNWKKIFLPPLIAFVFGAVLCTMLFRQWQIESLWLSALAKTSVWGAAFLLVELLIDRPYLLELMRLVKKYVMKKKK